MGAELAWEIKERMVGSVAIVEMSGRLTEGGGSDELNAKLWATLRRGTRRVLFECSQVTNIDSRGVGVLARCVATTRKRGGNLKLLCPSQRVRATLNLVRLNEVIDAFDDQATALASFEGEKFKTTLSRILDRLLGRL